MTAVINAVKASIDGWSVSLENAIPIFGFQYQIDEFGRSVEDFLSPLAEGTRDALDAPYIEPVMRMMSIPIYNAALFQLVDAIIKSPIEAIYIVLSTVWALLKGIAYIVVHPLRSALGLLKSLVELVEKFTHAKTWTTFGTGLVGGSLGQITLGNPLSLPVLIVGLAMILIGLAAGALSAAYEAQDGERLNAAFTELCDHVQSMPSALLTGYVFGLIFGAIQRAVHSAHQMAQAKQAAQEWTTRMGWGNDYSVEIHNNLVYVIRHDVVYPLGYAVN